MNKFNWEQYLLNYPDLVIAGITTEGGAYTHYHKYGKKEERTDQLGININTTKGNLGGRFGNVLFYNIVTDYFSRKSDLQMNYKQQSETEELLKMKLYSGTKVFQESFMLTDDVIDSVFENLELIKNKNLIIAGYFQTPTVAKYIKSIIKPNKIENECVFIHVRLGDITGPGNNEPSEYYFKVLSMLPKIKGYISSDSIDHKICKDLISNFDLTPYQGTEVETIKFGSSCKYLVLSKGTFSWWMGILSSGEVYYPDSNKIWHGDIFVFPDWKKIKV
jgi:hypothetical protein